MEDQIWLAIVALIAVATTLTEFFKRTFKINKKWLNELLSFVVAEASAFVAWILGSLPTWFTPEWECVLIEGVFLFAACKIAHDKLYLLQEIFDVVFHVLDKKEVEEVPETKSTKKVTKK